MNIPSNSKERKSDIHLLVNDIQEKYDITNQYPDCLGEVLNPSIPEEYLKQSLHTLQLYLQKIQTNGVPYNGMEEYEVLIPEEILQVINSSRSCLILELDGLSRLGEAILGEDIFSKK